MFFLEWFRQFLNWCSLPILVLLSFILNRRRLYRDLPLFFSYVAVTASATFIRLIVYILTRPPLQVLNPFSYSYIYWISSLLMSIFAVMAVYEIFIRRLFAGFYRVRFYRYLFPTVALAMILLALLTAILSPDQPWKFV